MSDIIINTTTTAAVEDDAYNKAISNYLLFRSKLEVHPQFDKEKVARIKGTCEQMMQNRPTIFVKAFSGNPEILEQLKSDVKVRISELSTKNP